MKMLITVEGTQYEVEVQVLDETGAVPAPVSAAPAARPASPIAAAPAAPAPARPAPVAPVAASGAGGDVPSPIAGNVLEIKVKPGDAVNVNDVLIVLEAMKMESNVASPIAGTVKEILIKASDSVTQGQVLVKM